METIFTKIIKGEIPCFKIAEDDLFFAFLDIAPLSKGHTLVVPKQQIDYIFDLENEQLAKMIIFAKKIAKAIQKNVTCKRIGMAVVGLEVPHTHIHLVPINQVDDMNFAKPTLKLTQEELQELATKIANTVEL